MPRQSEDEFDVRLAEYEQASAAWIADAPRRKQIGILKRQGTVELKHLWIAKLIETYPHLPVHIGSKAGTLTITWQDGPAREKMMALLNCGWQNCARSDSPAVRARKALEASFSGRLYKRRERDAQIAAGIARRNARSVIPATPYNDPRQISFAL